MPFSSGYITGIITNSLTKKPIEGVVITTDGTAAATPSGTKGEYLLCDTEGTYTMWAKKAGYKQYQSKITIIGSVSKRKDFSMIPA
jgi:hypothetical protein